MKTTHRNYNDNAGDFNRISEFIFSNNAQIRKHSTWCIGRFGDWKYALWGSKLTTPGFFSQNAELWFDGFGSLAGFVLSENGGPEIAIITTAGYRFLFEEMLEWALVNWGERGTGLSTEVTSYQALEISKLEQNGFEQEATFFRSHFDLPEDLIETKKLPVGYKMMSMHSEEDYINQLYLRQNAFGGKTEMSQEEIDHIHRISNHGRNTPIYHPETDLCVVALDGTHVSSCEALIDTRNLEADIERVCTHSDYRRKGFARIVIQECLNRLSVMGIHKVHITGYSEAAIALYGSIGSKKRTEFYIYKKKNS